MGGVGQRPPRGRLLPVAGAEPEVGLGVAPGRPGHGHDQRRRRPGPSCRARAAARCPRRRRARRGSGRAPGRAARARSPMGRLRRPTRATPSWSSTTSPSAVTQASLSSPVAPSFTARAKPSIVFSGAWARAPRWANPMGGSSREGRRTPESWRLTGPAENSGLLAGQGEGEAAALAEPGLAPDAPAVGLDDPPGQVEADPGAAASGGWRCRRAGGSAGTASACRPSRCPGPCRSRPPRPRRPARSARPAPRPRSTSGRCRPGGRRRGRSWTRS